MSRIRHADPEPMGINHLGAFAAAAAEQHVSRL